MASILDPLVDDSTKSASTDTSTAQGAGASPTAGSTAGTVPGATNTATPSTSTTDPQGAATQAQQQNQGFDFSPLTQMIQGQGTTARNAIGSANDTFQTGLGAAPAFGAQQQGVLDSALTGTGDLTGAQNLLSSKAPTITPINNGSYDPLVSQYQQTAQQAGNQNGLAALLGQWNPSLTPGERNYDSSTMLGNRNYQNAAKALNTDAGAVGDYASNTTNAATAAIPQRANDFAAFDLAGKNYVNAKLQGINSNIAGSVNTANAADANVGNDLKNFQAGTKPFNNTAGELSFDPTLWMGPQAVTSGYNPNANAAVDANSVPLSPTPLFDQTIDPSQWLSLTPGAAATAANSATPDEIAQYNRAQQLLGQTDRMTASPTARQGATIGYNNAAFMAALKNAMAQRDTADQAWATAHPVPAAATGPNAQMVVDLGGGSGDGAGAGADGGGGGDGGFHKGGLIKPRHFQAGGPTGQSPDPSIQDDIPARVDQGEFVQNKKAVDAMGVGNMSGLNQIGNASPQKQDAVRQALHVALSRASKKGMS